MQELIVVLLIWISSNTPLAYNDSHVPAVIKVPQAKLVRLRYQGNLPNNLDVNSINLDGVYNFEDSTIYLNDSIDLSTIEGQAVLVHELIHYLQYRHGIDKSVNCIRELEPMAYEAHAKYLTEHGKVPPFDDIHVLLVSTCWSL